jgi:hypothetical protein
MLGGSFLRRVADYLEQFDGSVILPGGAEAKAGR